MPLRNFSGNSIDDIEIANIVRVSSLRVLNLTAGDIDRNGIVNAADLAVVETNFGIVSARCSTRATPTWTATSTGRTCSWCSGISA